MTLLWKRDIFLKIFRKKNDKIGIDCVVIVLKICASVLNENRFSQNGHLSKGYASESVHLPPEE